MGRRPEGQAGPPCDAQRQYGRKECLHSHALEIDRGSDRGRVIIGRRRRLDGHGAIDHQRLRRAIADPADAIGHLGVAPDHRLAAGLVQLISHRLGIAAGAAHEPRRPCRPRPGAGAQSDGIGRGVAARDIQGGIAGNRSGQYAVTAECQIIGSDHAVRGDGEGDVEIRRGAGLRRCQPRRGAGANQ
ncbi:hypothetical protein G6F57_018379 [Rhizopus arrhizus]|nr:hypothetical protein G6F57_018379 [Rhizopus arrhizus]